MISANLALVSGNPSGQLAIRIISRKKVSQSHSGGRPPLCFLWGVVSFFSASSEGLGNISNRTVDRLLWLFVQAFRNVSNRKAGRSLRLYAKAFRSARVTRLSAWLPMALIGFVLVSARNSPFAMAPVSIWRRGAIATLSASGKNAIDIELGADEGSTPAHRQAACKTFKGSAMLQTM